RRSSAAFRSAVTRARTWKDVMPNSSTLTSSPPSSVSGTRSELDVSSKPGPVAKRIVHGRSATLIRVRVVKRPCRGGGGWALGGGGGPAERRGEFSSRLGSLWTGDRDETRSPGRSGWWPWAWARAETAWEK